MSDWMGSEITLGCGSIGLGLLAGRLCAWIAHWLPRHLEHQWQREARELLAQSQVTVASHAPRTRIISKAHPQRVQLGCAALSVVVTMTFGATSQALFTLLLTWCLLILSLIDGEHQLLPDALVIPGLWLGLILNSFGVFIAVQDALWGCVAGYLSLWSVSQLTRLMTGRVSMGSGDLKLLALIGAWGGVQVVGATIICSVLGAAVTAVLLTLFRKAPDSKRVPFGPFLCASGWGAFLFLIH